MCLECATADPEAEIYIPKKRELVTKTPLIESITYIQGTKWNNFKAGESVQFTAQATM